MIIPIPFSLYIHIPWCVKKCPYCDFNSHEATHSVPEEAYIEALLLDFDEHLPKIEGRELTSIFFGGGTPSLFSPESIQKILSLVRERIAFKADTEITLEANPGTVDESRFIGFRQAGINRLSIGIQSLNDLQLQSLGRIHNREYALRAIQSAIDAGFTNFNLDLMHGLPNQSITDALSDLADVLAFKPPHLSWYQLTIEPNTFFHHKPPILPNDNILWTIQEEGKKLIAKHGLKQYEVSAFSKPNRECLHNKNYWEFGDYLGIGCGAHSKLTHGEQFIITRHWQVKNPKDYLDPNKKMTANQTILTPENIVFEFMLNALRLNKGVSDYLFQERTGLPFDRIKPIVTEGIQKKLLHKNKSRLYATKLGQRFLNDLIEMFL